MSARRQGLGVGAGGEEAAPQKDNPEVLGTVGWPSELT